MNLLSMTAQIGMLAVFISIGAALYKVLEFQEHVKKAFMAVLIYVALPAIILDSIFYLPITDELLSQVLLLFVVSILFHIAAIGIGLGIFQLAGKPAKQRKELAVLSGLGNGGFLGIPLCLLLFGPQGALFAAVFDMGMNLVIWTVVVYILKGDRGFSWAPLKSLLNFPILSMVLGLVLSLIGFRPPVFVTDVLDRLAGLTVPLSMIFIGLMLMNIIRNGNFSRIRMVTGTMILKLVVMPLFIVLLLLGLIQIGLAPSSEVMGVLIVLAAMPTFTSAALIFLYCSADEELAALASISSTVVSLFTVPLMFGFGSWLLI